MLYGESGSGKTSLVTAGLAPRLKASGYATVYCRSYKDPLAAIVDECRKRSGIEAFDEEPPIECLRRTAEELDACLVILCDQFEEFFVNFKTRREREGFVSFVAACYGAADLPVKFLFSIRSDFLYLISQEFDGRIPEPMMGEKRYHLCAFDQEQAEEIIEKSAQRAGLPLTATLCREVARDLEVDDTVLPSELQIVGEQLQTRRIFTIEEYRRAGGKEQLVHSFLEDVIEGSGAREAAQLILRSLISDQDTRMTLLMDEIVRRSQRSREVVERVMDLFVQSRLIREIQEDEPWHYELMHEYLIEKINRITGRVMDATQRANRLLRQYLSNYSVDRRTRIPITKLWFIRRYSDAGSGEHSRELMRKSLRWGLVKASALVLLLAVLATGAAALLSIDEKWDEAILEDGHMRAALQAAFSPDGKLLVSVGEDAKVIVWDFERRMPVATLTEHTNEVTSVSFSPDGKWFATGSKDDTVIVWDAVRREKAAVLREHQGMVIAVAFSPDGQLLASASNEPTPGEPSNGRVILWNVERRDKVRELPARLGDYGRLIFSPNSRWLISSYAQKWDVNTGLQMQPDFVDPMNWMALSPDATRMLTTSSGAEIGFLDLRQNKSTPHNVHHDSGRAAAFSPDGRFAATGADDIVLWDTATMTILGRLEDPSIVWHVAFSPDGRWLVSTHGGGSILIWDKADRFCGRRPLSDSVGRGDREERSRIVRALLGGESSGFLS